MRLKKVTIKKICKSLFVFIMVILNVVPIAEAQTTLYKQLQWPFYDAGNGISSGCFGEAGGTGDSITSVHFPATVDPVVFERAIEDYIKNGWPASPLIDYADDFVRLGQQYDVNPVIPVMIAQVEYGFGTNSLVQPGAVSQYNFWAVEGGPQGVPDTPARFDPYPSIMDAMEDVYKLLSGNRPNAAYSYIGPPDNFTTIAEIMAHYAPSTENDTAGYIKIIEDGMTKFGESSSSNASVSSSGCGSAGGDGSEIGSVDQALGLVFPVAPQKKSQNGGVNGMSPLPCTGNCHHDGTIAFDISRQPGGDAIAGTPVYAIADGVIDNEHIYMHIDGCYSFHITNTAGGYDYYYTHTANPVFKSGDPVKAGQKVAEIGPRACTGNGSDSHLHIERGCVINGVPQLAGELNCRDPAFRGIINKLFEDLPD